MPYIPKHARDTVLLHVPGNAGELNYAISQIVTEYIELKTLSYQTINDIVGALEGAKLEFYRRVAIPYEDFKIKVNGDLEVYEKLNNHYSSAAKRKPSVLRGHSDKVRVKRTK